MTATPLPLHVDQDGPHAGIATLTLEQPGKPVVVLELEVFQRLETTLRTLPRGLVGLVIASASERVFVAGADLKSIMDLDDAALDKYLQYGSRVFQMVADLPFQTAAAINGAALGGGLELAMHCDGLIGAPPFTGKPYPVGLPEAGLKICPGWGGTNLLPARMDAADALRRTATGSTLMFDEAVKHGCLFDAVAPSPRELLTTAKNWVMDYSHFNTRRDGAPSRWIGRPNCSPTVIAALDATRAELQTTEPGKAVAEAVNEGLLRGYDAALAVERRQLIRLRNLPPAKEAIAAFFAKSAKK
ncbi:MAG TPA: enoyl-CoA hydratase/isomerase family protein [Phycisphaerales bacterium]|nr:enoyl-CoA hydratase/isomerase family protein [Phycisphaerales bacterium]